MTPPPDVPASPWQTLTSREVYANPWLRVREDEVVRPDGSAGIYGVVEVAHPAVFVVPVTDADEVVLVDLFRYTTGSWSTEVPAGSTDGEDPLTAARRELAEETGFMADQWLHAGDMWSLNGLCDAPQHVLVARGLRQVQDDEDDVDGAAARAEEGIVRVRRVPWPEVLAMVRDGRICDAESVAALMYAAIALGRVG